MKKTGIIGGTFDPPHNGHLLIANEVKHALELEEVWFMPNRVPPHKQDRKIVSEAHHVTMLELALNGVANTTICKEELHGNSPSYTYDTMTRLCGKHPEREFYFIIGGDMVEYLPKWYRINELLKLVTFVGVTRPGYSLSSPYPLIRLEIPEFAVSSSLLRERFAKGETTAYLLPEEVRNYIERNELYGTKGSARNC
jgi:nicotinate-nucleotide adenylyltransferase